MGHTYYAQRDDAAPTMTVGELIEQLQRFNPSEKVIFRSPDFGAYGPDTDYTIDTVSREVLEGREDHFPACTATDDETGEEYSVEAFTEIYKPWSGVVIR